MSVVVVHLLDAETTLVVPLQARSVVLVKIEMIVADEVDPAAEAVEVVIDGLQNLR